MIFKRFTYFKRIEVYDFFSQESAKSIDHTQKYEFGEFFIILKKRRICVSRLQIAIPRIVTRKLDTVTRILTEMIFKITSAIKNKV